MELKLLGFENLQKIKVFVEAIKFIVLGDGVFRASAIGIR